MRLIITTNALISAPLATLVRANAKKGYAPSHSPPCCRRNHPNHPQPGQKIACICSLFVLTNPAVPAPKPTPAKQPNLLSRALSAIARIPALIRGNHRKPAPKPHTPPQKPDFGPNLEDFVPTTSDEAVAWLEAMIQAVRDLAAEMIAAGALQAPAIHATPEAEPQPAAQTPSPQPKPLASPKAALQATTAPLPPANPPPAEQSAPATPRRRQISIQHPRRHPPTRATASAPPPNPLFRTSKKSRNRDYA